MRMMKTNKNEKIMVIGIDHGYGNMKTATRCFPSGVARYEKEPIFQNNLLVYNDMYYQIGEEQGVLCGEDPGRRLLCTDIGCDCKKTGGKRNEQCKSSHCSRIASDLGGYAERGFSEISASKRESGFYVPQ